MDVKAQQEKAQPSAPALRQDADSPIESSTNGEKLESTHGEPETPDELTKTSSVVAKGADGQVRTTGQIVILMGALCLAVFLAAIDITIITTALPTIAAHFQSAAAYTWIGSAYLLAVAAATPLWGKLSDIWGRKPVIVAAAVWFFVGSALCGWSSSIEMLIAGRAVQGVGGGGLIILVNICISDLFSMRNRATYFGIIGMVWALASALGPIVGGAFTQKVTWRWCFWLNLPCTGIAIAIFIFFLDLKTPTTPLLAGLKAIDWTGSLTITGGTLMFLLGLEFGDVVAPWKSAKVICLIVFGFLTWIIFFFNERFVAKYPVVPLHLFKSRSNLFALGVCFIHGMVFISGSYYLPLYFQAVLSAGPLLSGVYLLPFALTLSLVSAITGIFIRQTGEYLWPIRLGMTFMTLGFGLFIALLPTPSWSRIIIFQIIAGIGVGPNFQAPLIALQTGVPPPDIAAATATFGFTRNLATAISVVVGGVVFQNGMQSQLASLTSSLGPKTAHLLSGGSAGANVGVAASLPTDQQPIARQAFTRALRNMWILYVVLAVVGVGFSFLIARRVLSKMHEETKTGLENEEAKRVAAKEARRAKVAAKLGRKTRDVEAGDTAR